MKFDLSKCASVTKKEIGDNNYHISISFNNKSTDAKARLYSYLYDIGIRYSKVDGLHYEKGNEIVSDLGEIYQYVYHNIDQDINFEDKSNEHISLNDIKNAFIKDMPIKINNLLCEILEGNYYRAMND